LFATVSMAQARQPALTMMSPLIPSNKWQCMGFINNRTDLP